MNVASEFLTKGYLDALERRFETAPRDMAAIEALLLWGLGAAAAMFLLFAVLRRSSGAAVSFSLVTLTGLVAAMAMGRLEFLPPGTTALVLCLYAAAVLLFLAAAIRTVRDNTIIGAVVLVAVLGLAVLGGASALGVVTGRGTLGWSLVGVAAFALFFLGTDLFKRDKAAFVLAPGILAAVISPLFMLFIGADASPGLLATPLFLLAGGTVYAAGAAMVVLSKAETTRAPRAVRGSRFAPSYADEGAFFSEIGESEGSVARPGDAPAFGGGLQEVSEPFSEEEPPRFASEPDQPDNRPQPAQAIMDERPLGSPPIFAAAAPPQRDPAPRFGAPEPEAPSPRDPSSSFWGRAEAKTPPAHLLRDEYVFAPMEDEELRAGDDVLRLFDVREAGQLAPEDIRGALAPDSLPAFDDDVIGGSDPVAGRFSVPLMLASGRHLVFEGYREVDEDGLLSRLEGRFVEEDRNDAAAFSAEAPLRAGPADAAPLAAEPLAAGSAPTASLSGGDAAAALERGEIAVYFQPILRLSDRQTVGFEALARWVKPTGEILDASEFVPQLVEEGHGIELMALTIEEAARELAAWLEAQPGMGQFVSVNLAATDLPRNGLLDVVRDAVTRHGLPEGALVVELGEDRIKTSHGTAMKAAKALRAAGVSLAVDDFGTGYANLSRLSKFDFDLLKTDRSLAVSARRDKKGRAALRTVVEAAHKAHMPVIAEGIEDEETAALMAELGCDFGQGFLFGRPEPAGGPAPSADRPVMDGPLGAGAMGGSSGLR